MGATFDYVSAFDHEDLIGAADGRTECAEADLAQLRRDSRTGVGSARLR